jgi:1-deoxy-D-xylulose-5-phosphate reductoisomerase
VAGERASGGRSLADLATRDDVDLVLVATGGIVSLRPVIAALEAGKVVATANKETLVAGGHLVMPLAKRRLAGRRRTPSPLAWLRPIDSEHSAIWQCLAGERRDDVKRLILTASGGPFRDLAGRGSPGHGPTRWPTRRGAWAPRSRSTRRR